MISILSKPILLLIVSVVITSCAPWKQTTQKPWEEFTHEDYKQLYYENLRNPHGKTYMEFYGLSV